jgi:two-component system chemotaxis response regulator CheY
MKTCLVVDDSSVIRKVARRILEEMKFEISEAEDGVQALDMCRLGLPDVVFLDLNMPRMDGMTFLKEMRNLPGGERPKVVFSTTERDMAYINQALRAGADEFIMKPFDRDIVEAKFHRVGLVCPDATSDRARRLTARDVSAGAMSDRARLGPIPGRSVRSPPRHSSL